MRIGTSVSSPEGNIKVSVTVNGTPQQLYRRSDGQVFVAGRPGDVFQLQVSNLTGGRLEILNTVDGRNTLKDEPGDLTSKGLVFPHAKTGSFTGWRINNRETRQFVFGTPEGSVANRATESTKNVGWIGFAAYHEQTWTMSTNTFTSGGWMGQVGSVGGSWSSAATEDFSSASVAQAAAPGGQGSVHTREHLGTHIGIAQEDKVGQTSFTRQGAPDILILGYDTAENLRDIMIPSAESCAFPGSETGYERY